MCGISGTFGFDSKKLINKMLKMIKHRGPDDTDYFDDKNCSLGINRLSILDHELGKQPMFSEDKNFVLVFNGEIFNYLELKNQMIKQGVKFKTNNSDTEVILKLFEKYKLNFLEKLNGMFAIAIYDKSKKKLILARDRCGIKPLFYYAKSSKFVFASEIKSILKADFIIKSPNFNSINYYFSLKNIPAPLTAYKNIYQINPGEVLIIGKNGISKKRFWNISNCKNNKLSFPKNGEKILKTLKESVKIRMRADVEVGAFLSGGLDSSAVCALASKYSNRKLKTFTLIYEDKFKKKAEDRYYARKIAKKINSDHYEMPISPRTILHEIEPALDCFDQPFAGVLSGYFLSKLISKHVKTCLSGDGADELFGSYKFPRQISTFNGEINNNSILNVKDQCFSFNSKLRKKFMSANFKKKHFEHSKIYFKKILNNIFCDDVLNKGLILDFKTLLPDQVLSFVDIHSMHHSLEVRPPFLDNNLIDLSFRIPGNHKIKNGVIKKVLKESLKNILPYDIINRSKEGFVMPLEQLFIKQNKKLLSKLLSTNNIKKHGIFDNKILREYIQNINNNSFEKNNILWIIYCFQIWWNKNF